MFPTTKLHVGGMDLLWSSKAQCKVNIRADMTIQCLHIRIEQYYSNLNLIEAVGHVDKFQLMYLTVRVVVD